MNKEHLFGAPPAYVPVVSGESERDRRLRLRAEERARKLAGHESSAYESNEVSKRDQFWEMKKMQRLAGGNLNQPDSSPPNVPFQPAVQNPHQNLYKDPPVKFDQVYQKLPEGYYEVPQMDQRSFESPANMFDNDLQDVKVTKDQMDYAANVLNDLVKRQEPDKKRLYAEELKRQIEEKNVRKVPESFEQGFEIGNRNRVVDKNKYAAELEAQIQAKRPNSIERPISAVFGSANVGMSEREKKLKYARELEAQIMQKKQEVAGGRVHGEEYFPFPSSQDSGRDKKRNYAQELDMQVRARNNVVNEIPKYPYAEPEFQRRGNYEERSEVIVRKNTEDSSMPLNPSNMSSAELDKKARYRQELERQIEEQKQRKEEEKRKKRQEEELAEKRYFSDAKIDPSKPIIRQKTVDPNRPSEDNPQAERYKEFVQRSKKSPETNLDPPEMPKLSSNPVSTKSENKNFEYPELKKDPSYRPGDFQGAELGRPHPEMQKPLIDGNFPYPEMQNPYYEMPRPYPVPGNPYYGLNEGERVMRNFGSAIVDPRKPEYPLSNQLIETYMREIQETRLERDRAREQCLEMREMMLREKEKNLEQLLYLVKNQTGDSRPISYQEPRIPDRSSLYSGQGYRNTPVVEPKKELLTEQSKYMIEDPSTGYSQIYSDLYKDFKPDQYKVKYEQPDLIDVNPLSPPVAEEPDLFEKSLAGNSKWVELSNAKWGAVSLIDSVAVKSSTEEQARKKWQQMDSKENFLNSKPTDQTPRFCFNQMPGSLSKIVVDDESLPGLNEHLPYFPSKKDSSEELERSYNGELSVEDAPESIQEEMEPSEDYSSDHQEKEVEQTHEITMSNPKYEETDQYMIECDNWSESQSEAEIEIKRQVKNPYDRPKIIDVFKEKPINKLDSVKNTPKKTLNEYPKDFSKESPKDSPKESFREFPKEFSKKSPKKSPRVKNEKPENTSHGKIAFSRLEQARKHAKELKAKDLGDEVESSQGMFLDLPDFIRESASQSSFEGKFTQLALNELRNQKKKNNEMNSSKRLVPIDSKDLNAKFFAAAYEKNKGEEKQLPKVQSRRYID